MSTTTPLTPPVDPDLEPGQVVGEYVVERKIGQGGFGAVFRATHPLIGKVVAIKVLARRFSVDPEMVSRFQAEARAVNQIRHRNIIDIFSFAQLEDGRHYYVMEYLDGEPLDRRIERTAPVPLAEALPILRAIARALDAAHAKGIAHRDLKAENVFLGVDPDGVMFPKLLDFGIAKLLGPDAAIGHKTQTGAPMGTPYYMSPEQCRGRDVDHRTDHYAFGVLTYLVLTGKHPIDADDYMTILMRQITDDPEPASSHVPALPEGVDHAIAWLMHKDAAQRPPDLVTAVQAMEEVAGLHHTTDQFPSARTPTGMARIPTSITNRGRLATGPGTVGAADTMPPPARRGRGVIGVVVAVVVVAGIVAAVVVTRGGGSSGAAPTDAAVVAVVADAAVVTPVDAAPAVTPAVVVDAAVASREVTITLEGAPPDTEVRVGNRLLGRAPGTIQLPRGELEVVLVLSHDGYRRLEVPVTPDGDRRATIDMVPRSKQVPKHPKRPPPGSGAGSGRGSAFVPTNDIETFPK